MTFSLWCRVVGDYGLIPPLAREYANLDKRYQEEDHLVKLVCQLELWGMAPLCIWTYLATAHRKPERHILQVVTSLVHMVGTYFFTLQEALRGFRDIPADLDFQFTPHRIFYFWIFFVAANLLWFLLPLYYVIKGSNVMVAAVRKVELPQDDAKKK